MSFIKKNEYINKIELIEGNDNLIIQVSGPEGDRLITASLNSLIQNIKILYLSLIHI